MFFYVLLCSVTTWYCCIFLATQTHAHINEHSPRNTHTTARARTTLARHSPASSEKKGETAKTGLHSSLNWLSSYSLSLRPLEGHDVVVAWALKSYWSVGSPPSSTLCAQRTARVCVRESEREWMLYANCVCVWFSDREKEQACVSGCELRPAAVRRTVKQEGWYCAIFEGRSVAKKCWSFSNAISFQ